MPNLPMYVWIALAVTSGMLCLPSYALLMHLLQKGRDKNLAIKKALDEQDLVEASALRTEKRLLVATTFGLVPLLVFCFPALFVCAAFLGTAFDLLGIDGATRNVKNQDLLKVMLPALPFAAPIMFLTAVILRIFYTPVAKMKQPEPVSAS